EKCPDLERLDLGGGIGIDYHDADSEVDRNRWMALQELYETQLKDFSAVYLLEIGRFIVARAGVLLARVEIIKQSPFKKFLVLDTGMTHIMRPALYHAFHNILPVKFHPGEKE